MRRDPLALTGRSFDLLVLGAGIYGATIAWDAALRGLSVALVDRGDFGSGASANSLKTVHGGLRSLQRGSLREMRSFIRERRALLRIAPHLVAPIRFVIPTSGKPTRHRVVMRLALAVNDLVAADRNRGLDSARLVPPGGVLSRAEYFGLRPAVDPTGVTGGAAWSDAQMFSSERLVLAFVQSAVARGAVAVNHVEAIRLTREGGRVVGARVCDRLSGEDLDVSARLVVNAAGAWAPALAAERGGTALNRPVRFAKAMNLVTRVPPPPLALGATHQGRFYFRVPWRGISIFGTSQDPFDRQPDQLRGDRGGVEQLFANVQAAFPEVPFDLDDVTLVHRGLLPSDGTRGGEETLAKSSVVFDHRVAGADGLVTVVGVRYTTARETAARVVDHVFRRLGYDPPRCLTAVTPVAGGDIESVQALMAEMAAGEARPVPEPARERLARAYGSRSRTILRRIADDPALAEPLGPADGVTAAELVHAVEEEMAVTLSDALIRRTEAGAAGWPGEAAVTAAARVMAGRLGWDSSRVQREIADLRAVYAIE